VWVAPVIAQEMMTLRLGWLIDVTCIVIGFAGALETHGLLERFLYGAAYGIFNSPEDHYRTEMNP